MSIKSMIPGTAAHSKKKHINSLERAKGTHDVLLQIEWADKTVTYAPADYDSSSEEYVTESGLKWKVAGKGNEPVYIGGCPVVRVHSTIGCPVDSTASIAADFDEDNNYDVVNQKGERKHVTVSNPEEGEVERKYDMEPPDGCVGWTFNLSSAVERAPNPVSPQDLKDAEERGKMAGRNEGEMLKYLLTGIGIAIGFIVFLAIVFIVVNRLTGIGGSEALLLLAAAPSPWVHSVRQRINDKLNYLSKSEH